MCTRRDCFYKEPLSSPINLPTAAERAKQTHIIYNSYARMASLTLNASHMNLKSTTNSAIRTSPALISLNTTRPIISFPKAKPHQLGLQRHVVSSSAMAETADKHYYDDILSKPSLSSLEPPLKVAIVGFGNFGQFIAKGLSRQGHVVLATSRSDYSDYCERHGFSFFRYKFISFFHSKPL